MKSCSPYAPVDRQTRKYGSNYGLRLTLNVNTDEYMGLLAQSTGIRLIVHNEDDQPDVDQSLFAGAGERTMIGIRRRDYERMPAPYTSQCVTDYPADYAAYTLDEFNDSYSQQACRQACVDKWLNYRCGCVQQSAAGRQCDVFNVTEYDCIQEVFTSITSGSVECDCALACNNTEYFMT